MLASNVSLISAAIPVTSCGIPPCTASSASRAPQPVRVDAGQLAGLAPLEAAGRIRLHAGDHALRSTGSSNRGAERGRTLAVRRKVRQRWDGRWRGRWPAEPASPVHTRQRSRPPASQRPTRDSCRTDRLSWVVDPDQGLERPAGRHPRPARTCCLDRQPSRRAGSTGGPVLELRSGRPPACSWSDPPAAGRSTCRVPVDELCPTHPGEPGSWRWLPTPP